MVTATQTVPGSALADVFDLDPTSVELTELATFSRFNASGDCTDDGCKRTLPKPGIADLDVVHSSRIRGTH